jgi:signal transduction histidine kinase
MRRKRSSLGLRLFGATALVVLAALLAVGLLARSAAKVEFQEFLTRSQGDRAALERESVHLAGVLEAAFERGGRVEMERALRAWASDRRDGLHGLLFAPGAGPRPHRGDLPGWSFERSAPGVIEGHRESPHGEVISIALRTEGRRLAFNGETLGELYLIPLPSTKAATSPEADFRLSLNRWLVAAVLGVGVLSLALTAVTLRRILAPVRELTGAAATLGAGDLAHRVAVRGGDELGQLAASFNAMADALAHHEKLHRDMVADTAHELRTPITNLRCQIEAMEDGVIELGPSTIASLRQEVLRLERLVDDLQTLALADAGQLHLEIKPVELAAEVRRIVDALALSRADGPTIGMAIGGGLAVHADPHRLAQVLTNLLCNAVEHSPAEGSIRLSAIARGADVEIAVEDDGPGIAAEHLPRLFDRYYRTDPSRQRATGGSGLGLAIVKQLVAAQGGRLGVENCPEAGARFWFTLPRAG